MPCLAKTRLVATCHQVHNTRMAKIRIKRPRDPMQLAKLIGDIATGQIVDEVEDGKNPGGETPGPIHKAGK